jgi:4-hydroxy-tetrahydrodipicolinate reductase
MYSIALIGYGKMGHAIENILKQRGHQINLIVNSHNLLDFNYINMKDIDIAIEFSNPDAAYTNIKKCLDFGVPVISGTTGWLNKKKEIEKLVRDLDGGFFYASNYSIGVNVFFALNEYLARMMNNLPQYNPSIEEIHHTQKLDAPSGTAITIADGIMSALNHKKQWVNHPTVLSADLEIVSKRIDPAPGTHLVDYRSLVDTIQISHTAHSREGFATGAVLAAEWMVGKKGCFGMKDMLGF